MTQEQYDRAVTIGERLKELNEVKKEINDSSKHLITYCESDKYKPCYRCTMKHISDILDRHDKMIRAEIDEEIEKLKKEIEAL